MKKEKLTLAEIEEKYHNKWVGLGDPEYDGLTLVKAYVVSAAKNHRTARRKMLEISDDSPYELFASQWVGDELVKDYDLIEV